MEKLPASKDVSIVGVATCFTKTESTNTADSLSYETAVKQPAPSTSSVQETELKQVKSLSFPASIPNADRLISLHEDSLSLQTRETQRHVHQSDDIEHLIGLYSDVGTCSNNCSDSPSDISSQTEGISPVHVSRNNSLPSCQSLLNLMVTLKLSFLCYQFVIDYLIL